MTRVEFGGDRWSKSFGPGTRRHPTDLAKMDTETICLRPMSLRPGGGGGLNPFASFGKGAAPKGPTRVRTCHRRSSIDYTLAVPRQCPRLGTGRLILKLGGRVTAPRIKTRVGQISRTCEQSVARHRASIAESRRIAVICAQCYRSIVFWKYYLPMRPSLFPPPPPPLV